LNNLPLKEKQLEASVFRFFLIQRMVSISMFDLRGTKMDSPLAGRAAGRQVWPKK